MTPTLIDDTVKRILTSHVYDVAIESPIIKARKLSRPAGCEVYLKREDLQPVHSFKIRGAYNKIYHLSQTEKSKGLITASAGNHAQGVAFAAKKLGISALIIMPRTTPAIKVEAVQSYGAEVELFGDNYSEAAEYCKKVISQTGRTFIHPYDDPLVIAGQGTIGREILEQLPEVTHIFVPVGGGGLLAGVAAYVKALRPDVKVISVEPEDSNAMQESIKQGKRVTLNHVGIFADGVAVKQVGNNTFDTALHKVDDFISVNTDQMCAAIKRIFEETRSIVEPAGALGTAGLLQYGLPKSARAVAICSGANMTFERLQLVSERTLLGSGQEAMFAVTLPEKPGALYKFCNEVVGGRNISEFSYRLNRRDAAHLLVGIGVSGLDDKQRIMDKMRANGYEYSDLTMNEIAKEHIRHMIGGRSPEARHEKIYEVTFPERPGALIDFLKIIGDKWNISLFHYRSAASDSGSVMIGFEAARSSELEKKIASTTYEFESVSDDLGIKLFF
ncbi:MAG TPA: threonine ammonia-lyase, biosynthetic [Candidatus Saccharimonadales bacterium]|nr:threonine ammonia-lyase, biosynthetic [Candidatus Saccharimonadales bacterium]